MIRTDKYVGIQNEVHGGMTSVGKIIRDAWVFDVIEETETCEGWKIAGINALLLKVEKEWDKYGCMVSNLPKELFEKHKRINDKAIKDARIAGWTGEYETMDDT